MPAAPSPALIDRSERICIVGAGPAGLAQARAFKRAGVPFDVIERHRDLGGLWDIENPGTPMYESAHFISSKGLSAFFDFPMPGDTPDYPGHAQVLAYLRAFARAYGLTEHIAFGVAVERAEPEGHFWRVVLGNGEVRRYRGLVCANGMNWDPAMPDIPGHFEGELRHAVTYRGTAELEGRRVLIVGGGNSGCDIACDAAQSARAAFLSLRRGYTFIPKHVFGLPADVFGARAGVLPLPLALRQRVFQALLRLLNGDPAHYGLPKPDHRIFESHPIVNSLVLHHLGHGDLKVKTDVTAFAGDKAVFADGSEETVDLVLLATGYDTTIPYMARQHFEWAGNHLEAYMTAFNARHATLFTLGFINTAAGVFEDFDRLAHLIANHLVDQERDPEKARKFRELVKAGQPDLSGGVNYVTSPRHAAYVQHDRFRAQLEKLRRGLAWPALTPGYFDALRSETGATAP
ncbi:MAG: NAD(P)-binding domain-containing protein [Rhodospirillales bacterium]|nr:NAD(P)-binding domain-containing protein [Rhodospirillales bacterium]MDH3914247.1 NAD(P)-binding domain-containing protein [Rhodospirillales bacterium]